MGDGGSRGARRRSQAARWMWRIASGGGGALRSVLERHRNEEGGRTRQGLPTVGGYSAAMGVENDGTRMEREIVVEKDGSRPGVGLELCVEGARPRE